MAAAPPAPRRPPASETHPHAVGLAAAKCYEALVTEPTPIRVAIVEDDRRTREALELLIDGTPGFSCVESFGSVEAALRQDHGDTVDVVLLDIELPGTPGSEGARLLGERHPEATILMLTVFADADLVFQSIRNGASGYLLKKTAPDRLLAAIREAHAGGAPMSPEIARRVLQLCRQAPPPPSAHDLTPQEVRVLALIAEGHGYQAAAEQLGISLNTVRDHVRSIYHRLHVHTRSEAVSKAYRRGILPF
jgi:DNA-binding NarL/FixJ family response regulator